MIKFEAMQPAHWSEVKRIYEQGISTGNATFELESPEWEVWNNAHLTEARIIAKENGAVIAWAALTPVSGRCVYNGVAEVSIYVSPEARGRGLGQGLLAELIFQSESIGLWTLQAGIFPENVASINIHEKNGFRKIGYREKIAKLNNAWRDTLLFERRSKKVGVN